MILNDYVHHTHQHPQHPITPIIPIIPIPSLPSPSSSRLLRRRCQHSTLRPPLWPPKVLHTSFSSTDVLVCIKHFAYLVFMAVGQNGSQRDIMVYGIRTTESAPNVYRRKSR